MPMIVESATGGSASTRVPRERLPDALEHPVGGIRLHLEADEVAVVRSGAVAAAEVVAGHEDDPSLGQVLGLAEAGAARRVQVPVAAVVGAARDRDDDERSGRQLRGGRGDDRHGHPQGLAVVHRRGDVDGAFSSDHGSRCSDRRARSSPFSTLPLALSGSALTTSTRRGTL